MTNKTDITIDDAIQFLFLETDQVIADTLKDVVSMDGNFMVLSKSATDFQEKCFIALTTLSKKRQNHINKILNTHS